MLYLASKSPRRRELLARLGVPFSVQAVDIPEVRAEGETPEDYVARVADEKAVAALGQLGRDAGTWVLGSDTEVVLDGEVFGKPVDADDAARMLARLSGREHRVLTAVSLRAPDRSLQALSVTVVEFAPLTPAQIDAYVTGGEPMGKAGAYAIQGGAEAFVVRLSGSYSGVMGLPLYETACLLREAGIEGGPAVGMDTERGTVPQGAQA
ncbi:MULTISPECIES: Maf family protein [unclassified Luteimonas]